MWTDRGLRQHYVRLIAFLYQNIFAHKITYNLQFIESTHVSSVHYLHNVKILYNSETKIESVLSPTPQCSGQRSAWLDAIPYSILINFSSFVLF